MSNSKKALADALNILLANYFALYFKSKNFHWHVSGAHFREYHLLFDEQAAELIGTTDLIAERVRKIGYGTHTSPASIIASQSIQNNDEKVQSAQAMLEELRADNISLVTALKQAKDLADSAGDNATGGLIDDWTDEAEQRVWFLTQTLAE